MERLTKRIDGRLVFPTELIGVMMTPSNDTMCQILTRLAAYEDTGLDPGELNDRSKTFPGIAKAMAEQWAGQVKAALKGGEG